MEREKQREGEFVLVRADLCNSLKLFQENKTCDHLKRKHIEIKEWQEMRVLRI